MDNNVLETLRDLIIQKLIPDLNEQVRETLVEHLPDIAFRHFDFEADTRPAPLPEDRFFLPLGDKDGYECRFVVSVQAFPKRNK